MKILYLYRYAILGGVSTQLKNRLDSLKGQVDMHFGFLQDYGGTTAFGDYKFIRVFNQLNRISDYIRENSFDVVIVIDTPEVYKAIKDSGFKGTVINEVHTTTKNISYLETLRESLPMSAFITPSKYLKGLIDNDFGFKDLCPTYVVYNCLNTSLFQHIPLNKQDKKIIAWIGKLDDHKNWRAFLALADMLRSSRDDCEYWIIGGQTAKEQVVQDMLTEVGNLNLHSRFRWIERIEYDAMPKFYSLVEASGGLTVSTSINESFGMTLVEAMACECPVVAPSVGAIQEILNNDLSFCLYDSGNLDMAYDKINTILNDSKLREKLILSGKEKVIANYSLDRVGGKYLTTIENICKTK